MNMKIITIAAMASAVLFGVWAGAGRLGVDRLYALMALVGVAMVLLLYFDYCYRKHWTGYSFGYPLEGFDHQVFFTFDDGPSRYGKLLKKDAESDIPIADEKIRSLVFAQMPEYDFAKTATDNLLDFLQRQKINAIFFLLGHSIETNPHARASIRRMAAEGHIVANHSFSHRYARRIPHREMIEEFTRNHRLVAEITGQDMQLFRPPHGDWEPDLTKRFLADEQLAGYSFPLFWASFFKEWALRSVDEIAELHARLEGFRCACQDGKGKIVLLHDIYIPGVILASLVLAEARKCGYVVGDVHALAAAAARETSLYRRHPFIYYLRQLIARFTLKLSGGKQMHANYEMG